MNKGSPPKRPFSSFFIFAEKMRKEGKQMSAKECGLKWKEIGEEGQKPYYEEYKKLKEDYEKYLYDITGEDYTSKKRKEKGKDKSKEEEEKEDKSKENDKKSKKEKKTKEKNQETKTTKKKGSKSPKKKKDCKS